MCTFVGNFAAKLSMTDVSSSHLVHYSEPSKMSTYASADKDDVHTPMIPSPRLVTPEKNRTGYSRFNQRQAPCRAPSREEMTAVFRMCRGDKWNSVLNSIRSNRNIQTTKMTMDNNIATTVLHQAITSKSDTKKRVMIIQEILQVTPHAASMKNGYGSLPLHVICQRNVKMDSASKEMLIRDLINADPGSLTQQGGVGKRTPLHIIFTDYISPALTAMMIGRGRQACFMHDKHGFLPAHVACSRHCSPEKLQMLLDANPASLLETTTDGRTLLDLAKAKATKSHPNFALISDIERRLKLASTTFPNSASADTFDSESKFAHLRRNSDKITFDSHPKLESTTSNRVREVENDEKPKGQRKRKRKRSDFPTVNDEGFYVGIKQEDTDTGIVQDESDPANLLLHFSRHMEMENVASV